MCFSCFTGATDSSEDYEIEDMSYQNTIKKSGEKPYKSKRSTTTN